MSWFHSRKSHQLGLVLIGCCGLHTAPNWQPTSSWTHGQVSGALQELGVNHSMEVGLWINKIATASTTVLQEKLQPYVADVRLTRRQRLIEIDGSLSVLKGKGARVLTEKLLDLSLEKNILARGL